MPQFNDQIACVMTTKPQTYLKPIDIYKLPDSFKGFHGKNGKPTTRSGNYRYHPIVLGFANRETGSTHGNVSYATIKNETMVYTGSGENTTSHKVEIKDNQVFLNDIPIAEYHSFNKSKTLKEKFCKSIVWSLMNDPISLQDKLAEINNAPIPAIKEDLTIDIVPDLETIEAMTITNEGITGYPEFKHYEEIDLSDGDRVDLISMSSDESENFEDDHFSDILHIENLKEIIPKIPDMIISPISVISTRFIPWLNLTITEEVIV
jgi:hypothetical protein